MHRVESLRDVVRLVPCNLSFVSATGSGRGNEIVSRRGTHGRDQFGRLLRKVAMLQLVAE
jgi:hypothetical protein